jgi:hypothetical protein
VSHSATGPAFSASTIPGTPSTITQSFSARIAASLAFSGEPAPSCCPTSTLTAIEKPTPTTIARESRLMPVP